MKRKILKCITTGILSLSLLAGSSFGPASTITSPFVLSSYAAGSFNNNGKPGGRHDIWFGAHNYTITVNYQFNKSTWVRMLDENGNEKWAGSFSGKGKFLCGTDIYTIVIHLDLDKTCNLTWD